MKNEKEDKINIVLYKRVKSNRMNGRDYFEVEIECPSCLCVQIKEATISKTNKLSFKKGENKHCMGCGVLFCL